MTDLWPDFSFDELEENKAVEILREQARLLEQKTDKKVKATFSKIEYKNNWFSNMQADQLLASQIFSEKREIIDEDLQGKKDANELYRVTEYKFEIYNDVYRFRVFVLRNSILFPIEFDIDGGIREDIKHLNSNTKVNSNSELRNLVESILSSQKLRTIILQMMHITAK